MADQPIIRFATEDDIPTILEFIQALAAYENASHEVEATLDSLRATLSFPSSPPKCSGTYTLLISPPATASNPTPPPAGMAMFFYNYSTWRSAPGIYLEDLFVRPEQRGKGYGLALLRRLAAEVAKVGGKRLEWSVLRWNEPSIKFYTSESVGAKGMEEWMKMMVDGDALTKLAAADRSLSG